MFGTREQWRLAKAVARTFNARVVAIADLALVVCVELAAEEGGAPQDMVSSENAVGEPAKCGAVFGQSGGRFPRLRAFNDSLQGAGKDASRQHLFGSGHAGLGATLLQLVLACWSKDAGNAY